MQRLTRRGALPATWNSWRKDCLSSIDSCGDIGSSEPGCSREQPRSDAHLNGLSLFSVHQCHKSSCVRRASRDSAHGQGRQPSEPALAFFTASYRSAARVGPTRARACASITVADINCHHTLITARWLHRTSRSSTCCETQRSICSPVRRLVSHTGLHRAEVPAWQRL